MATDSLPALRTILLVDDSDVCRITTEWFLANLGYEVHSVGSAEEALQLFDPTTHDLLVTDNSMPGMTGAQMTHVIKMRSPSTPIIMYTSAPPIDHYCVDVVIKRPTHLLVLRDAVRRLLTGDVAEKQKELIKGSI